MRVFGIDCGSEFTGYGIVELDRTGTMDRLKPIAAGAIALNKQDKMHQRLAQIYAELTALLQHFRPDVAAIEGVFYASNAKSAITLGQVRGVALLAAANAGVDVAEYAPLSIKAAVTGYGLAQKQQVQFMVARLLGLETAPEPADAADALAIAICHLHNSRGARALRAVAVAAAHQG